MTNTPVCSYQGHFGSRVQDVREDAFLRAIMTWMCSALQMTILIIARKITSGTKSVNALILCGNVILQLKSQSHALSSLEIVLLLHGSDILKAFGGRLCCSVGYSLTAMTKKSKWQRGWVFLQVSERRFIDNAG